MAEDRVVKLDSGDEVYLKDPNVKVLGDAETVRTKAWRKAVEDGAIFQEKLNDFLVKNDIWSQKQQDDLEELKLEIQKMVDKLEAGGIKLKEAERIAKEIILKRVQHDAILASKLPYLNETVEARARNQEFSYLVSQCAVYNDNRTKKYFKDFDDFLMRKTDDDLFKIEQKFSEVYYGLSDLDNTPEKNFLRKYKFVDEELNFINKEGHKVDIDGHLIDDEGYRIKYVKNKPVRVDAKGKVLKEQAPKPFLDDDGKPILEE